MSIEIVPKEWEKEGEKKELLIEDTGEDLEWDLDKEIGEYGTKEVKIDRATMKAIARRSTAVKILRFLYEHKERGFSNKELYTILGMYNMTVNHNLRKILVKSGVVECVTPFVDRRYKLYRIANLKVAEAIIRLHDRMVSFKLARLLPYSFVSIEELKKNSKFLALCAKYKLSVDEAIEALMNNRRKVEPVFSHSTSHGVRAKEGKLIGFRRKEQ